jgi:primary-amine oxidase
MATEATAQVAHPLEPLSAAEIEAVGDLLSETSEFTGSARIVRMELNEPSKAAMAAYEADEAEIETGEDEP